MKTIANVFAAVSILSATLAYSGTAYPQSFDEMMRSLDWRRGPEKQTLYNTAELFVPAGFLFLNPQDAKKFMEANHNLGYGTQYLFMPEAFNWYASFDYEETGHVQDDEKIDADSVLATIREATEENNKLRKDRGWPTMTVVGWKYPPFYDAESKRLTWAVLGKNSDGRSVVNYNTRILGRTGVTAATLVTSPETLDSAVTEFKKTVTGYQYLPGKRYDQFSQGDRVAEYGLAALIAGGAAAVATKKGLWAVIAGALASAWKLIVGAAIALVAGLRALFKKKT